MPADVPQATSARPEDRVTGIVVTYNSAEVIAEALDSIAGLAAITVVDNASTDGTCAVVAERFPQARLIRNARNVGFGSANNQGEREAGTEFVLLLNPDARLLPGALSRLVEAADRYPQAAILAPLQLDEHGRLRALGYRSILERRRRGELLDAATVEGDLCVDALSGAVMLVRRAAFAQDGHLFDPRIVLYFEDDDLCLRARRRGQSLVLVPAARSVHLLGRSSTETGEVNCFKVREHTASYLYVTGKHRGRLRARLEAAGWLLKNSVNYVLYLAGRRRSRAQRSLCRVRGVCAYLSRSSGRGG